MLLALVFVLLSLCSVCAHEWSPWLIDKSCPVFYFAPPYEAGFGDENVQFQFGINMCRLLNLTFVFAPSTNKRGGHAGENSYEWLMENILGINFTLTQKYISDTYHPMLSHVTYQQAIDMHKYRKRLPCRSYVTIPIRSCIKDWCKIKTWFTSDNMRHFAQDPKENCKRLDIETNIPARLPRELYVFWSIRSGDVCYDNCNLKHHTQLDAISRLKRIAEVGYKIHILFHTQNVAQIDSVNPTGQGVKYMLDSLDFISDYRILESMSFVQMACQLYNSDIVIPSHHSSFIPMLLLYAVPNNHTPILIDESMTVDKDTHDYQIQKPRDVTKPQRYANILELLDVTS